MPRKPKRPCRYPGCPNLTDNKSGWCDAHEKKMQQHYTSTSSVDTTIGFGTAAAGRRCVRVIFMRIRFANAARRLDATSRRRSSTTSCRLLTAGRMTRRISRRSAFPATSKFISVRSEGGRGHQISASEAARDRRGLSREKFLNQTPDFSRLRVGYFYAPFWR